MNEADDKNNRSGPPSLHEILHGTKDPKTPHLAECLVHLDQTGSREWLLVLEGMAGEITELRRSAQHRRGDVRPALDRIANALQSIMDDTDRDDVREVLTDDIARFEHLTQLKAEAECANAAKIRAGSGRDTLHDALGIPSPELLAAACIYECMRVLRLPRRADNPDAWAACNALSRAAGDQEDRPASKRSRWERHLRDARAGTPASKLAKDTARWHISAIRHRAK